MKSTKCVECGFVGWSDVEHCKACGAPLGQRSHDLPSPTPVYNSSYEEPYEEEGPKKGMAIAALVIGIIGFFTAGILSRPSMAHISLIINYLQKCMKPEKGLCPAICAKRFFAGRVLQSLAVQTL